MRRILALSVALGLALTIIGPAAMTAAAPPRTTTYVSITCFVDWQPEFRFAGRDDQTGHHSAVITNELWVYDTDWHRVGTEIDTVRDQANSRTGTELFRGAFVITGELGAFDGTFVWTESPTGRAAGGGVGRAVDGSGHLLRWTAGVVDPAATGVPECAAVREVYNLTRLEITEP